MNRIKILHVASFTGNIGDNASHIGLYSILREILGDKLDIEKVEIRRFYKNYSLSDKMQFDAHFVEYANKKDLLIIGGGGFFDYWVPNSYTGTTIDITKENLDCLSVPTLFVSVGCMPHKPIPEGNIDRFHGFLSTLCNKKNVKIAFRNDGSLSEIKHLFGDEFDNKLYEILDNGFFYKPDSQLNFQLSEKPYIAVNTTLDQLTMQNRIIGKIDYDSFKKEFRRLINSIIEKTDYLIAFVPHIYKDLQAFDEILKEINDYYIRSRVVIAPYVQGDYGCNMLCSVYQNSSYVVGMRFHSNVCPIAMNKPIVGLAALDRVVNMYNSVNKENDIVMVNKRFSDKVLEKILNYNIYTQSTILDSKKLQTLDVYKKILSETGVFKV